MVHAYYIPLGTQVSRSESRRFLLVKAVLMPTTTNAFGRPLDGAATPRPPFCLARSTASSISSDETDLSRDLGNGHVRTHAAVHVWTVVKTHPNARPER